MSCRAMYGGVHRLERGVREVRDPVRGLDDARGFVQRPADITVVAHAERCLRVEPAALLGTDRRTADPGERPRLPLGLDGRRGLLRLPEIVRQHGNAAVNREDVDDAGELPRRAGIVMAQHRLQLRGPPHDRHFQSRQPGVDAVAGLAEHLRGNVGPLHFAADPAVRRRRAQLDPLGHGQPRRLARELAISERVAAPVDDRTGAVRVQRAGVRVPASRGSGQQHLPGAGARLADRQPPRGHAAAFAGELYRVLEQGMHRRDLRDDPVGRNVEFLGEQRHVSRGHALPQLDLVDLQDDGAIRADLQPCVWLQERFVVQQWRLARVRLHPAEHEPGPGETGRTKQYLAARKAQGTGHAATRE
jgi:hypothetical protein